MTPKSFRIKSFGCQMNAYDGERMADLLSANGMAPAADGDDADLVVLNTCHIREKAAEKAYSDVGRLRREDGSRPLIALAGCVAQAEGAEAKARSPMIDMVVGPQAYHRLPDLVAQAARGARPVDTDMPAISKFGALPRRRRAGTSAFLTIQEGCDKFCTYCVVPYTRGAEISPACADIIAEAQGLVDGGAREITLLGQNVNAWADGTLGLAGLIRRIAAIDGLERIRYTTSHPANMSDELIAAHGEVEKLMPYLHLPVQSGSDPILKAMNRSHTRRELSADDRARPRGAAGHRHLRRLHRRLPRRKRRRLRSDAEHCRCGALRIGVQLQIFAAPGHAGRNHGESHSRHSHGRAAPAPSAAPRRT